MATTEPAGATAAKEEDELDSLMNDLKLKKKKKKTGAVGTAGGPADGTTPSADGDEAQRAAATTTSATATTTSRASAATTATSVAPAASTTATQSTKSTSGSTPPARPFPVDDRATYVALMTRVYDALRANNPDLVNKKKAIIRPPQVMRVGTARVLWVNFAEICKMMKRDPDHVFRYFLAELGTTGSIDGSDRFLMKGKFVPKYIESLLKKYINEYVTCQSCRGVDTRLSRDSLTRMHFMHCESCGASRAVQAIQKGYHATSKGERRTVRNKEG